MTKSPILLALAVITVAVLCLAPATDARAQASGAPAPKIEDFLPAITPKEQLDQLEKFIKQAIKKEYARAGVDDIQLRYGAIKGMVASLHDPHSEFLTPEEAKQLKASMDGKFFGIGAELGIKDGWLTIMKVKPDSPALKAGLKQGDRIAAIDGAETFDETLTQAVGRIRGDKGAAVTLTIVREGAKKPLEIKVVRGEVVTNPELLTWKIRRSGNGKKIIVIKLPEFDHGMAALFDRAVAEAVVEKVDGVVLDLRNDPGGLLVAAQYVACAWLGPDQSSVVIEHRGRPDKPQRCGREGALRGMPTVVLVNKYSASASEIVAGALQDHGAARIIGETSYGKGSVQAVIPFPDGSMLRLTVDLWKTPLGHHIDKRGITPDEKVKADPDDIAKGKDAQLKRATEYLTRGK